MKKITLLLLLFFAIAVIHAQDYKISFAGTGESNTVGTVKVENLTQGKSVSLLGTDLLHLVAINTGIIPIEDSDIALRIYPNPTSNNSTIEFEATASGKVIIELFDITGKRVCNAENTLTVGTHSYQVSGLRSGIYSVRIYSQANTYFGKLVSNSSPNSVAKINYLGNSEILVKSKMLKSASAEKTMQYTTGDRLKFTGISGSFSTIVIDIPTQSKIINFAFKKCTDADGNNYPVVQIGTQIWMAENLKTTKFNDSTDIPNVTDNTAWTNLKTSGYCWYNNDFTNKTSYGALYNWYTANAGQLAPLGWHIPTDLEWTELTTYLGGESLAGAKLKEIGTIYWNSINEGTTNETGFGAMPGGARYIDGTFVNLGSNGDWWSSTQFNVNNAWKRNIYCDLGNVSRGNFSKQWGISMRCIYSDNLSLPTLSTTSISGLAATSAVSGGNISSDGGSIVTARGVCWSTLLSPTTANSKTTDGTGVGIYTSSITGLMPGTTYYVRAYATNSTGTAYGSQISFTTSGVIQVPTLTTTSVTSITSTSAISGGNISSDGGATITVRGVCWNTSSSPTISNSKTTDGAGAGSYASSITGLTSGKTYYVRAYATNNAGTAYGSQISFTTSGVIQVPTLTTTSVTSITSTSAISGGNISSDGGAPITVRGVCWSTSSSPTTTNSKTTDGMGAGIYTSSITGLAAGKTYYVRAYATNSIGTAYGSEMYFNTTLHDIPTLTTTIITEITTNSAKSGGNITSDGGSVVTERGVCWSNNMMAMALPTINDHKTSDGTGLGSFVSSINGLGVSMGFRVRAYATNNIGTAYGEVFTRYTLIPKLPTVGTYFYSNVNSSATVGGIVTTDGGGNISERGVCWSAFPNPTIIGDHKSNGTGIGKFVVTITGLGRRKIYYIRAYATNEGGTAYGDQISFETIDFD